MPKRKRTAPQTRQRKFELTFSFEVEKATGRVIAAYIEVNKGRVVRTDEYAPGLLIDIGAKGQVIGVEMLRPHKVTIKLMAQAAEEYDEPRLRLINPRAVAA